MIPRRPSLRPPHLRRRQRVDRGGCVAVIILLATVLSVTWGVTILLTWLFTR